jgi:LPXTG-site transpeptidase (sortase) family protein
VLPSVPSQIASSPQGLSSTVETPPVLLDVDNIENWLPSKPERHSKVVKHLSAAPKLTLAQQASKAKTSHQPSPKSSITTAKLDNIMSGKKPVARPKPTNRPLVAPSIPPVSSTKQASRLDDLLELPIIATPAQSSLFAPLPVEVSPKSTSKNFTFQNLRTAVKKLASKISKTAKQASSASTKKQAKTAQPAVKSTAAVVVARAAGQTVAQPLANDRPATADFTAKVLASAVNTKTNTEPVSQTRTAAPLLVDNNGAAAINSAKENVLEKLSSTKLAFTFKINTSRLFAVLRILLVVTILAISAYLAWDTWMTNRAVEDTFSNPASAMSIDGVNPTTADPTSVSNEAYTQYTTPADHPRYIYIQAINVRARVQSVGVTSKGNIDAPKNLNDTAWYDGSAKPNQDGQVFIDGHTSFSSNLSAAFNDLPKLKVDDPIVIELGDGNKVNYKVVATETAEANKVDMGKALNTPSGAKKGLTLMTCTGKFNYRTQTSDKRFIVYAVQVE